MLKKEGNELYSRGQCDEALVITSGTGQLAEQASAVWQPVGCCVLIRALLSLLRL